MDRPPIHRNAPVLPSADGLFYAEPDSNIELRRRQSSKRKKTLVALLEELQLLKDEDLGEDPPIEGPAPQIIQVSERIKNHPIMVDDRLQEEGSKMFFGFSKRIRQLDEQLLGFGNAVRPLGSSAGLISSAYALRCRLQQILHLFRENAAEAFPDKVKKEAIEPLKPLSSRKRSRTRQNNIAIRQIRTAQPLISNTEAFPDQFEMLAKDLLAFLHFLHDIPEFTDESLNASVLSFDGDLKYWASCMREFENQFQLPAMKRYVNDLTKEMDEHLENIRDALRLFVTDGVSTIRTAQNHTQTGLQNLSTVATFFSGVTATTFQYSFDKVDTNLEHLVNALWISSLVFSIASSINSQLAYHWRAAMYRSPRNAVPWWVIIWLTRTPLIFLVVSVMAFSAGLVCFTYSSVQGPLVTTCATIFTSVTSLALLAVGVWFAAERLVYTQTKGHRWLTDYIQEKITQFNRMTGITWVQKGPYQRIKRAIRWVGNRVAGMYKVVAGKVPHGSSVGGSSYGDGDEYDMAVNGGLPTSLNSPKVHERKISDASMRSYVSRKQPSPLNTTNTPQTIFEGREFASSPVQEFSPRLSDAASPPGYEAPEIPSPAVVTPLSPGLNRFRRVGMKVIQSRVLAPSSKSDTTITARQGTRKQSTHSGPERGSSRDGSERYAPRPSRIAIVIPALKKLMATQYLTEHQGLVRHLQFSPDGRYLATCSWDRRALIWKVGDPFTVHRTLLHPGTGFIGQVAWSPSGSHLLTKMYSAVKLWAVESGVLIKTIHRKHKIEAVTWSPTGKTFACVQRDHVHIIDLQGKDLETHRFERMEIHDVAFTPDEQRLLVVATLSQTISGLVPSKSRAEKRILVYDLRDKEIENQVPVLENVRDVTVSGDGQHCLVSYEDTAPPEVWRIDLVNKPGSEERQGRLALVHTYMPKTTVDFAGPSYFGGVADQFIVCAGKQGDIHIWDRETGLLLHSLQGANMVDGTPEDLTGIAWNHNAPGQFMFASATHDGTVRIWTAHTPPETEPPSRAESPTPPMPKARIREVKTIGVDTS